MIENIVLNWKPPFCSDLLCKIAPLVWARVELEPEYGYVWEVIYDEWKENEKRVLFRNSNFNLNPLWSVEIAKDKWYTNYYLKKKWYSIPEWNTFFSSKHNEKLHIKRTIDDWFEYAIKLCFPVVLKPNNLSRWILVWKVSNKKEYYALAKKIFKLTNVMIVEKFAEWNDYRLVVLDNEVISTYQRIHLNVTWNWKSTILELLQAKQLQFERDWRWEKIDFSDFRIRTVLKRKWFTLDSVLADWQNVSLLDNANLSTWWDSEDFTTTVHPDFVDLAVRVTKDMWLRLCGVDIITSDITKPLQEYRIIEINWAPWLDNYAAKWEEQQKVVEWLYIKILQAMWK